MDIKFKSKFETEDIVWFMCENKPTQGIICRIIYHREEHINTAFEHRNIFHRLKSLLGCKKVESKLSYQLGRVTSDGSYLGCGYYKQENELFKSKEELLKSL